MSLPRFWFGLVATSIALSSLIFLPRSTQAIPKKFYCAEYKGVYRTFANSARGRRILFNWINTVSGGWTPVRRCQEVSGRLQKFSDNNMLRYLRTGYVNRQPVICVVGKTGGNCNSQQVLLTLKPNDDPEAMLLNIMDLRRSVTKPISLNDDMRFYVGEDFYVDAEKFLEALPDEE
jgi:hypothetical protein